MDNATTSAIVANAFQLWFGPEIERRVSAGLLPKGVGIWGAQVLLELGRAPVIRLNQELRGIYKVRPRDGVTGLKPGDQLHLPAIDSIEDVALTEAEANAAHLTVLFGPGGTFLSFDFRYNAGRIRTTLDRSHEFLDSAASALRRHHYAAFWDHLFTGVELLSKALLLALPDVTLIRKPHHGRVRAGLNDFRRRGNIPDRFVDLFNSLSKKRDSARYGQTPFTLEHTSARKMLRTARDYFRYVDRSRPRRHGELAAV